MCRGGAVGDAEDKGWQVRDHRGEWRLCVHAAYGGSGPPRHGIPQPPLRQQCRALQTRGRDLSGKTCPAGCLASLCEICVSSGMALVQLQDWSEASSAGIDLAALVFWVQHIGSLSELDKEFPDGELLCVIR